MASQQEPTVGVRLWPQIYAIARLRSVPVPFPSLPPEGAPAALIVGHDEVSLLAPERAGAEIRSDRR